MVKISLGNKTKGMLKSHVLFSANWLVAQTNKHVKAWLFWYVMLRRSVVICWRYGTASRSHLQGSLPHQWSNPDCQYTLHNIPEEHNLIYAAAECCNHTEGVSVKTVKTEFWDHQNVTSKWFAFAKQITQLSQLNRNKRSSEATASFQLRVQTAVLANICSSDFVKLEFEYISVFARTKGWLACDLNQEVRLQQFRLLPRYPYGSKPRPMI